jgi:deazaflavin-dependent oxidoreductase (nitroreductase family)
MNSRSQPARAGQQGLSLLQLHHVGAKSGSKRITPLAYWPVSDTSVAVLASNYGAARHPGWHHNLIAQPTALVEIDRDWWTVNARVAPAAERALVIDRIASSSAAVTAAMSRTTRQIPVVVLELVARRDAGTD